MHLLGCTSEEDCVWKDFFILQWVDEETQIRLLAKMDFFPIHVDLDDYSIIGYEHTSWKQLILVKGIGVVYFWDSPIFDELYPIWDWQWPIAWYWIKRWDSFEMYTIDYNFLTHPITGKINNWLSVRGDFSSYNDLVSFIQFYYAWVFNHLKI